MRKILFLAFLSMMYESYAQENPMYAGISWVALNSSNKLMKYSINIALEKKDEFANLTGSLENIKANIEEAKASILSVCEQSRFNNNYWQEDGRALHIIPDNVFVTKFHQYFVKQNEDGRTFQSFLAFGFLRKEKNSAGDDMFKLSIVTPEYEALFGTVFKFKGFKQEEVSFNVQSTQVRATPHAMGTAQQPVHQVGPDVMQKAIEEINREIVSIRKQCKEKRNDDNYWENHRSLIIIPQISSNYFTEVEDGKFFLIDRKSGVTQAFLVKGFLQKKTILGLMDVFRLSIKIPKFGNGAYSDFNQTHEYFFHLKKQRLLFGTGLGLAGWFGLRRLLGNK